jgi:hypothetical protein
VEDRDDVHDNEEDYSDALPLESALGDYRITGYLGRGSFGITYRARDMNLRRDVAIKEYMPREWARRYPDHSIGTVSGRTGGNFRYGLERFTMEAQNLAACRQDNIVKVHRLLEDNCTSYMVMELLEGDTLEAMILRRGRVDWSELGPIFRALLNGCREIHKRGILHRDIKPSNIVLRDRDTDRDGVPDACQPVLIDFGAAREIRRQAGSGLSTILTDGYAPLEQYSDKVPQGPFTDIHALAATIYHALTGIEPLASPARSAGGDMADAATAAKDRAPDDVLAGIDHGLRLAAAERPQSVDLWLAQMPSLADIPAQIELAGQTAPLISRRAAIALGGAVALTGVAAYLLLTRPDIRASARPLSVAWARDFDPIGRNGVVPSIAASRDGICVAASISAGETVRMLALSIDSTGAERGRWMSQEENAQGYAVQAAPDGGLFIGGGANMRVEQGAVIGGEGVLIRLGPDMAQRWRLGFDQAVVNSLIPQPSGEMLAVFDGVNRSGLAMLQRVSADGRAIGERIELNDRRGDSARRVIALDNGALAVLGFRDSGPTTRSIWISCVNADGRELWRTSDSALVAANGFAWSEGLDIAAAGDALFAVGRGVLAAIDTSEPDNPQPLQRPLVMRLTAEGNGEVRWVRGDYDPIPARATANASARCVAALGDSEPAVYVAGWRGIPYQGWIRQIDGRGDVIWENSALGPRGFAPTQLHLDESGGYVAGVYNPNPNTAKLMVVKLING